MATEARTAFLDFQGLGKSFPGVRALDDVSFGVSEGSVHALLGENGAGKSTLLKILSGAYRPDQGQIVIGGEEKRFRRTVEALNQGVAVIYQELQLVSELSVAENLLLGHMPGKLGWMDRRTMREESIRLLHWVGENIDPSTKLGDLPIAQRQMVEIAKALSRNAKVLAFDEPTSSLSSREVDKLFQVIRQLRDEGRVILYVSHRMDEIFALCDAGTVLRDGKHVETFTSLEGLTQDDLVRKMVGRTVSGLGAYQSRPIGDSVLKVNGLVGPGLRAPVSFQVQKGEILGIFGLVGAGRTEMLRILSGAVRPTQGSVQLGSEVLSARTPRQALNAGIALCPEDRKKEGIVAISSVQDNINLGVRKRFSLGKFVINSRAEAANAEKQVKRLRVKTPTVQHAIGNLSGGNQQKAIIGRVLGHDLKVLLLDEPTRGIDVGAKQEVHDIVRGLASEGVAVVAVSSEMPELLALADRILVMRDGQLSGELSREEATQERLLSLALPLTPTSAQ